MKEFLKFWVQLAYIRKIRYFILNVCYAAKKIIQSCYTSYSLILYFNIDSDQQNKIMYLHTLVAMSPNVVQYIFSATDCQAPSNPGWAWSQLTSNVLTVQDRMKYERYVLALTFRPWGSGYKRESYKTKT